MSREASRTTTKSKMALSATRFNGEPLTFVTESPTPDSTIVLDTLRCFLKYVKITIKIKLNDKIIYKVKYQCCSERGGRGGLGSSKNFTK